MTNSAVKISIVIPVYNSSKTIHKCVQNIYSQLSNYPLGEIIVVDNGKNGDLSETLKDFPLTVLNRKLHASAAYARNEGASFRESDILIFIDSDVIVEPHCIDRLIAPILNRDCQATIGNYSAQVDSLTFAQKYKQLYIHYVYKRQEKIMKNHFWTAISAIGTQTFHKTGGFDANYNGASGEDHELGIRLTQNGYAIHRVENALGLHVHDYTVSSIIFNDIKKGLGVLRNSFDKKVALTDHSHVAKEDILAVFFSSLAPLLFVLSLILGHSYIAGFDFLALVFWLGCKYKLLQLFVNAQGMRFTLATIPIILILDWVRAYCVIYGFLSKPFYKNNSIQESTYTSEIENNHLNKNIIT